MGAVQIRDRRGNNLIVEYLSSYGTLLPANVQYTQTPATGASYPYTVAFQYIAVGPEEELLGYIAGAPFNITRRLHSIDVRYGGASGVSLRQYRLTYSDSPTTQRARLAAVQECGGSDSADCLAPTTISYHDGQVGIATPMQFRGHCPVSTTSGSPMSMAMAAAI